LLAGTGCFQGAPCLVIATLLAALAAENGEVLVLTRVEIDMGEKKKLAGPYRLRDFIHQHGGV
jgi:hypothetical protein